VLHLSFISDPHRTGFDHTALTSGKTEVGQQRLLFSHGEVGVMSSTASRLFENGYAVAQHAGWQIAHRAGMPTEYGGNLLAGEPKRGAQPNAQDAFVLSGAGGLGE
jgi:hypothetical protein